MASTTQFASRFESEFSQVSYECVRQGEIRGWHALQALMVFITVNVQMLCTVALLVVYLWFYDAPSHEIATKESLDAKSASPEDGQCNPENHLRPAFSNSCKQFFSSIQTNPKRLTIFLIGAWYSHLFAVFPAAFAIHYMGPQNLKTDFDKAVLYIAVQRTLHGLLAVSGLLLALAAPVPQIKLMLTRYRHGEGLGSLSEPGLWLQFNILLYLGMSQASRLGWPRYEDASGKRDMTSGEWFIIVNGCAVGFWAMSLAQVVVLGTAKWIDHRLSKGRIALV